jgi:hypothetical protein
VKAIAAISANERGISVQSSLLPWKSRGLPWMRFEALCRTLEGQGGKPAAPRTRSLSNWRISPQRYHSIANSSPQLLRQVRLKRDAWSSPRWSRSLVDLFIATTVCCNTSRQRDRREPSILSQGCGPRQRGAESTSHRQKTPVVSTKTDIGSSQPRNVLLYRGPRDKLTSQWASSKNCGRENWAH